RSGTAWRATTDERQPPRPIPITQTAKPVVRSPTDLPKDLSYGQGRRLVYVPAAVRVVRIELRAQDGNQTGLNQVQIDHAPTRCGTGSGPLSGTRELSTSSCGH